MSVEVVFYCSDSVQVDAGILRIVAMLLHNVFE